jgi:hypothetical protein
MDLLAPSIIFCPAVTAQVFSELSGLPLGVVEAQLDRRILPVLRLGKRRLVDLEALRLQSGTSAAARSEARSAADVPLSSVPPQARRVHAPPLSNYGEKQK